MLLGMELGWRPVQAEPTAGWREERCLSRRSRDLCDQRRMIYHLSFDSCRIKCTIESEVAAYKEIYL